MRILTYLVRAQDEGRTVQRILHKEMRLSRSLISRLKFADGLYLDGQRVHSDKRVQEGQVVEARLKDEKETWGGLMPSEATLDVVYEDEDLLIVNKPAPLPSIASAKKTGDTLEGRAYTYFGCPSNFVYRPVNRLDKGTSGLMVVAKNAFAQEKLQKDLHTDRFIRRYLAVGEGKMPGPEGVIDLPISREIPGGVRRVVGEEGKPAMTHYRVLQASHGRTLVQLQLETGRTHQIRVHMQAMGCPLVGDYLYGKESDELPGRFALHSWYVELRQPVTGETIRREAPMPDELRKLL